MLVLCQTKKIRRAIFPRIAAVAAANDTAHLETGVQLVGIRGIGGQANDACRKSSLYQACGGDDGERLPGFACVLCSIDGARCRSGKYRICITRIEQERPDHPIAIRKRQCLPMLPVIVASIGSILGACIDHRGIFRMNDHRSHLGCLRQPCIEGFPALTAEWEPK